MAEESAPESKSEDGVWIGFDLGGTKMMAVVFDDDLNVIARKRRRTREKGRGDVQLERLAETIEIALESANVDKSAIRGIGAGCPGPLDLTQGMILQAPNLGWVDVRLQEFLENQFGCPASICNDVDAGVYGEYSRGAAQGARCVVGVFPGTGIGGGCVYEGKIFHGTRASCMEVGFIQMATEGAAAGVGPVGTLEGIASRLAISAEAAKAVYRGQAPNLAADAGSDLRQIRSGALSRAIEAGDTVIRDIIARAAEQVGRGIGSLVNLLAPDIVVLGGGLVEAMPELYLKSVRKGTERNVLPSLASEFEIKTAELGDYATATGAAAWVRESSGSSS